MRLATANDAPLIQTILDDADVRNGARLPLEGEVKAEAYVDNGFFTLIEEGICFICAPLSATALECHTLILPSHRGPKAKGEAEKALELVFTSTDVTEIFTKVAHDNRPAKLFTTVMGFSRYMEDQTYTYYHLTLTDWMSQSVELELEGKHFHHLLSERHRNHEDIPQHDRAVGFACKCIKSGLLFRGLDIYNVQAVVAGWIPIRVLSLDPVRLDLKEFILRMDHDTFTVEEDVCQ